MATAEKVLRVPNGALRYKPDLPQTEIRALLEKSGIGGGGKRNAQDQSGTSGQSAGAGQTAANGASAPAAGEGGARRHRAAQGGEQPGGGAAPGSNTAAQTASAGNTGGAPLDRATIWKLTPDKQLVPVLIKTGITDHTLTEVVQVLKGSLNEGDQLVTGTAKASSGANRAPGAPGVGGGPPRGR